MFAKLLALLTPLDYPRVIRHQVLNHLNFGTHIKKPDSMNHVKLIEFHKDSANCKAFVKDYNSLAKTVCSLQPLSHPTEAWRRHACGQRPLRQRSMLLVDRCRSAEGARDIEQKGTGGSGGRRKGHLVEADARVMQEPGACVLNLAHSFPVRPLAS